MQIGDIEKRQVAPWAHFIKHFCSKKMNAVTWESYKYYCENR